MQALSGPSREAGGCPNLDSRQASRRPAPSPSALVHRTSSSPCAARRLGLWSLSQPRSQVPLRRGIVVHSVDPNQPSFSFELLGPRWSNSARLTDDMLTSLMELPGTRGMYDLRTRADALGAWKTALQRGTLPRLEDVEWPQEPFKTKFAVALKNLEMPRFTRRYPAILNTLLRQMLGLAYEFEEKLAAAEREAPQRQQQQPPQQQQQSSRDQAQQQQEEQQQQNGESQQASAAGGGGSDQQGEQPPQQMEISEEELQKMMQDALEQAKQNQLQQQEGKGRQMQIKMKDMEGDIKDGQERSQKALSAELERIADDIVRQFEAQMGEIVENLEQGEMAFDDLNALLDSEEGFDLSRGTWRRSGWRDLAALREVLEKVPELRELVRQLGRGGGRGPLRRAPEELEARGYPPGVIRSPLQPEEVRGLARSGDLSRMLPSEMALLAHGWPRKGPGAGAVAAVAAVATGAVRPGATATGSSGSEPLSTSSAARRAAPAAAAAPQLHQDLRSSWRTALDPESAPSAEAEAIPGGGGGGGGGSWGRGVSEPHIPATVSVSSGEFDLEEYYLPGAHAARRLHRVRRAERMLLSYDRTGWLDDQPARVTSRVEIRPAAELGPIILCLDTSGSMRGARETVAKALALECLRGAHRQRRACYLYAFSGPSEVQELELRVDLDSLDNLLAFLSCSFQGGTDVDAPLKLSLERLAQAEWSQADILMVTDGEINSPDDKIVEAIRHAHTEMGLEVHGLLVSSRVTEAMRKLCTDLHVFKSWTAVGGQDTFY